MPDRNALTAIAIAGITSGVGAASINIAARFATDPSDVLGFAGGILGAGLAVLGALYVEHWKGARTAEASQCVLGESMTSITIAAILAASSPPEKAWGALLALRQSFDGFADVSRQTPIHQAALNTRIASLKDWIPRWRADIDLLIARLDRNEIASNETVNDISRVARAVSITTRWVIGPPGGWPSGIRPTIADMHAHADQVFPDRLSPGNHGPIPIA